MKYIVSILIAAAVFSAVVSSLLDGTKLGIGVILVLAATARGLALFF